MAKVKAKGIEGIINHQTQEGFFQKIKRKLSRKALAYGLAFSLLFPLARMVTADTVHHKTHSLKFSSPDAIYGEKQNPTTKLEVRVDCDKVAEREYEIKLSFSTQDWNKNKNHISDYVLINKTQSNFYLVYPKDTVMVGEPKESAYLLSRKHGNEKISGQWKELKPLEDSPAIKWKASLLRGISEIATIIFGGGKAMKVLKEASVLFKDKKKLPKNYSISKIPFYPADKEVSARTFTIPVGIRAKAEKPELSVLLDVGLKSGSTQSEIYGQLKSLLVELPLETLKEKIGNLEGKLAEQTGAKDNLTLSSLEKKVIVDEDTSFYIPISVPQGKDELKVTLSRKEDSRIGISAYLYYPSGKEVCKGSLGGFYTPHRSTETLWLKLPPSGKYTLKIKSDSIEQINISSNCPIEEPKYQINGSVKGGDVAFYAIDVNEINSAEPLLCRLDWENSGHPVSIKLYNPVSQSSESRWPKGLSDIGICKTSPSVGKWILAVRGDFAKGGLEKFILQSYHHKIQGLRCEKHKEVVYDEKTFFYNQQQDGNLLVRLLYGEYDGKSNINLFYPSGKRAWREYLNSYCNLTSYFSFAPAGRYKLETKVDKPQMITIYFVSSQNAYSLEKEEKKENKEKKN